MWEDGCRQGAGVKTHFEYLRRKWVDILKWTFKKRDTKKWNGLIWLRIWTRRGLLATVSKLSGSKNWREYTNSMRT
jgi:hypothetical protein